MLDASERQAAFSAARQYINKHDAGIHVSDPMLHGMLDAMIAALEPIWAEHAAPPPKAKVKAGDND